MAEVRAARPSPALPTAASPMKSDAAARKSAISHPSHSSTATPLGGGDTPAPSARRSGGEAARIASDDGDRDPLALQAHAAAQREQQREEHDRGRRAERADRCGEWSADLGVVHRRVEEHAVARERVERNEREQRERDGERERVGRTSERRRRQLATR